MISIIAFIVVIFGSLNWLSIGFFQYDLVAGLFGFQGSIFSRMVYIVIGICAIYLVYVVIKNKGKITVKKLKKQEQVMVDKMTKKDEEKIENDKDVLDEMNQRLEKQAEIKETKENNNVSAKTEHINN